MPDNLSKHTLGLTQLQSGQGVPSHVALKGSLYIDVLTSEYYKNTDGISSWSPLVMSAATSVDTYVTGFTYNNLNKLTLSQNNGQEDINVYLNQFSGLTVNGTISATTFYGSGLGLNNIPISGVTDLQNSLNLKTNLSDFVSHTGNTNNPHQTTFYNLISTAHTHTISDVIDLQTTLNSKFNISGGTITGSVLINGSLTATTFYGDGSQLTGLVTNDFYVTGGTFDSTTNTLTLDRQNGSVTITGFTSSVSETCTVDTTSTYGLEYKKITTISGLTQGSYIIKSYVTSFSGTSKYGFWERTLGVVTDGSTPVITKSTEDFDKYSSNFVPSQIVYTPTAGNNIEVYLSGLTSENLNWTSYYEVVGQNCNGGVGTTTVTNNTSGVQINDLFSYQFLLMGA